MSQAKNPKPPLSSQKRHPCESCGLVLRDIFLLVDQQGTQQRPTLLRCGACAKPFYFSAQRHQQQEQDSTENCFISSVDRVSLEKSCNFHVSWTPCTSDWNGKYFLVSSGCLKQLATHIMHRAKEFSKSGVTFKVDNVTTPPQNARKPMDMITHFLRTRVSLQKDSVVCVVNVGNLLPIALPSMVIKDFILGKGLMSMVNV